MLIVVGLVLGGIFWFINFKGRMIKEFMLSQGEPLQTVSTTKAELPGVVTEAGSGRQPGSCSGY